MTIKQKLYLRKESMVSVIIPSYNREKTIKKAIDSVLNQTWNDLEVIVVDDGSTDNTSQVISEIKDDRLKYVHQENAGACVARNRGINLASGEIIAFHDSDDLWRVDKLEKEMEALQKSGADVVFCKLVRYNPDGSTTYMPSDCKEGLLNPIRNLFGIGTQTLLAKREVFTQERFDEEMPRFQEFELLYRISKRHSIYCVDEGLVDYYVGADSISSNPKKVYNACKLINEKHPELIKEYPEMGERMAYSLLLAAAKEKKKKNSIMPYINMALKCHVNAKIVIKTIRVVLEY